MTENFTLILDMYGKCDSNLQLLISGNNRLLESNNFRLNLIGNHLLKNNSTNYLNFSVNSH